MLRLVLAGVLVAVVIGLAWWFFAGPSNDSSPLPYAPDPNLPQAPDFSFPDASGESVVLSEVTSPLRIVHFWASWDPSSADALEALAEIERQYGDAVAVIALNRDAVPAEGEVYLEGLAVDDVLTFAYDKQDSYYRELGGYNMPETVFLGSGGEILYHAHGPMTIEELTRTTQRLVQ